jgi:hypothetical protein
MSITELGTPQLPTPTENNRVKQCNVIFSIYESTIEHAFVKQRDLPPSTCRHLLKNTAIPYYVQGLLLWASHHFQVYMQAFGVMALGSRPSSKHYRNFLVYLEGILYF